jgi:CheY-like chemotaxis protein
VGVAVVLQDQQYQGRASVENLSARGAFLTGELFLAPGSQVDLVLQLQGHPLVCLEAVVLRTEVSASRSGFAVTFRNVPAEVQEEKAALPKVLILDDSAGVGQALTRDLRRLGLRAVAETSFQQAQHWLCPEEAAIETVVADLRLGEVDGSAVLLSLSERQPGIRRVLMSGDIRRGQLELARIAGHAHAVLPKPWDQPMLRRALGLR